MKKEENLYIQILKWAQDKSTIKKSELIEKFNLSKDPITSSLMRRHQSDLFTELDPETLYVSLDGYFKLLEYEELKEARESSEKALFIATLAFVVSAVLAVGQLFTVILGC